MWEWRVRSAWVLVTVILVAIGLAVIPVDDAWAVDPSCENQAAPLPPIEALPWAQQMYDPANKLKPFSTGAGVTVAVLDSGVDPSHQQLQGKVLPGIGLVPGLPPVGNIDCLPHGTAVASIIAAQSVPGVGFAGLAPDATILPVRVSDKKHTNPQDDFLAPSVLAQGINDAVANGADVVALSAVSYLDDPALKAAVDGALAAGVVIVAAVGDGHDERRDGLGLTPFIGYPAVYDGVIGVGAVGEDGARAPTSAIGWYLDLVAPGLNVTAASFGGHDSFNGTGMAVGFVAAAAALMLGQRGSDLPGLSGPQRVSVLTARLLGSADGTIGGAPSLAYGYGLVDPYRAMTEATVGGTPRALEGRQPPPRDQAAERLAAARAEAEGSALRSVLVLAGLVLVVLAAAFTIPRARRRRWRPGRDREVQPEREDKRPEFLPGEMLFRSPPDRVGQD